MTDRWLSNGGSQPAATAGWNLETLHGPSRLWGANGIVMGPNRQLMVTQVFGSQVTAIDIDTGVHAPWSPQGAGIALPDDGAFGHEGSFFATEPMNGAVSVRRPDGSYDTLADDLPGANGVTMDHTRRRLFVDEFRPGGRLLELDPTGETAPVVLLDDLTTPNALAMGPDGALYFPQVVAGEIWRYDLEDRSTRLAFDGMASPCAVKFDSLGRLVTTEAGSGEVTRIEIDSGARVSLASLAPGLDNLAIGPNDRLFVSHFTDGRVAEVLEDGTERVLSDSGLIGPFGLTTMSDGTIIAAEGLSVAAIGLDGSVTRIRSLLKDLPTIAVGVGELGGDILISGQRGQVLRCHDDGSTTTALGPLTATTQIAPGNRGTALVVERPAGRIHRLHENGRTDVVIDGLTNPWDVAEVNDRMWIATDQAVVGFQNADLIATIDGFGRPRGITSVDEAVYVADSANGTVTELRNGERSVVASGLPFGPPRPDVQLPSEGACLRVASDGALLVGCDGDGTIRRLTRA